MKNDTPQKAAMNSQIEDLIKEKYLSIKKDLQRGIAFVDLSTSIICNAEIQNEDITDGDDDNGIDSIYIASNEQEKFINVFTCKSSLSDDFSEKDLKEFKNGLEYLFEKNKKNCSELKNKNLIAKIENIREEKESILKVSCYCCVFNGKNKEEGKVLRIKSEIENYFSKYFAAIYPKAIFSIELISAEDLFLIDIKRKQTLKNKTIELPYFGDKTISSEIEIDNATGRLATVKGKEIAKLVKKYGESLFEKNVRGWMTFRKYNKDILESCSSDDDAELFWFLNNGITIVCEKCVPDPDKKILKLTNPQIINGQQTSMVLQKAMENSNLRESVKILIKIYETETASLILKVAKSTNSQLAVKSRDLVSNNSEQIALQNEFRRQKYFYERQRGEKRPHKKDVKDIFNSFFVAQSILAVLLKKPSLAKKRHEDVLFGDPLYSQIFMRNFEEIFAATLLCNFCIKVGKNSLKNTDTEEIKYFAPLHIARIMWEKLEIPKKLSYKELIESIENNKVNKFNKIYQSSVILLEVILNEYRKKEEITSIGHFFARLEIDKEIFKKINQ